MTEERDISGFAFSFAVGILAAASIPFCASILCTVTCMYVVIISAIFMGKYGSDGRHVISAHCCISLTAFATGVVSMSTSLFISSGSLTDPGTVAGICRKFCRNLTYTISSIPFSHADTTAIMTALLTGDKSLLSNDVISAFSRSGASHILALSGLHLGIIYGIINKLSGIAGGAPGSRRAASLVNIALCGSYTMAVGAGASIVRAFIFIVIYEAARISHRQVTLKHVLPTALILQLATDPSAIRSVSFQLSYAAMTGIAYIYPVLRGFWPESSKPAGRFSVRRIWETAALSISCQMTTAPLAWHYFKSFPVNFLLSNLIALPLTGAIIPLSILTIILHGTGLCPDILIRTVEGLTGMLLRSLTIISSM